MMPFLELTLHLILSNRSLLSRFSGKTEVSDAGASALGASLKDSQLTELSLSEWLIFCSERRRHPAVTNDAILELTLHLILSNRSLLSRFSAVNSISDAGKDAVKRAWSDAGKSGGLYF